MARSKNTDGPSKMGLVRDAMSALGGDPKPKAIHDYIKSNKNVDISTTMISSYKSMILKKGAPKRKGPGRPPKSASMGRPSGTGASIDIADIATVKALVRRIGARKLSELISVVD